MKIITTKKQEEIMSIMVELQKMLNESNMEFEATQKLLNLGYLVLSIDQVAEVGMRSYNNETN